MLIVYFRLIYVCNRIIMETSERKCLQCKEILRGRSDQKFCSDQCRTTYNNNLNKDNYNQVRNINNILRRNRRILEELSSKDLKRIDHEILSRKGFNFQFHTSTYTNKRGQTYYFCYEQGYLQLNDHLYFLVKNQVFIS